MTRSLSQVDPEAAKRTRSRYSCFDNLAGDPQRHAYAATLGMKKDCEDEVVRQLMELQLDTQRQVAGATQAEVDELFYAQQNARVAQNAEVYYRSMFHGRDESWNLRDIHMADTLRALQEHLPAERRPARIIGHTTRISGTPERLKWGEREQINLGQLVREQAKDDYCLLLTLTAAP